MALSFTRVTVTPFVKLMLGVRTEFPPTCRDHTVHPATRTGEPVVSASACAMSAKPAATDSPKPKKTRTANLPSFGVSFILERSRGHRYLLSGDPTRLMPPGRDPAEAFDGQICAQYKPNARVDVEI